MSSFHNPSEFTAPKPSDLGEENAMVVVKLLEKQPKTFVEGVNGVVDAAKIEWLVVDGPSAGFFEERQLVNSALVRVLIHPRTAIGDLFIVWTLSEWSGVPRTRLLQARC